MLRVYILINPGEKAHIDHIEDCCESCEIYKEKQMCYSTDDGMCGFHNCETTFDIIWNKEFIDLNEFHSRLRSAKHVDSIEVGYPFSTNTPAFDHFTLDDPDNFGLESTSEESEEVTQDEPSDIDILFNFDEIFDVKIYYLCTPFDISQEKFPSCTTIAKDYSGFPYLFKFAKKHRLVPLRKQNITLNHDFDYEIDTNCNYLKLRIEEGFETYDALEQIKHLLSYDIYDGLRVCFWNITTTELGIFVDIINSSIINTLRLSIGDVTDDGGDGSFDNLLSNDKIIILCIHSNLDNVYCITYKDEVLENNYSIQAFILDDEDNLPYRIMKRNSSNRFAKTKALMSSE